MNIGSNGFLPCITKAPTHGFVKCGVCENEFRNSVSLHRHLITDHNIDICIKDKSFVCMEDFLIWKDKIEIDSTTYFKVEHTLRTIRGKVIKYVCNRSGRFKSRSKQVRNPKVDVSIKMNYTCSAFIMLHQYKFSSLVHISYSLDHYGHDTTPCRVRIHKSTKSIISKMFDKGQKNMECINNYLYENGASLKEHSLTYKHFQNHLRLTKDADVIKREIANSSGFIQCSTNEFILGVSNLCM